ncbi:NAD(P)-dependent oxidoreductase [Nocardia carnea]|uniref:NAD(P)-dependent oxidoreductase n=1 Tax=Nocardia carnea TaxID=37328 RepID=UPI0024540388|nr:NAD(P)-binding domain-containing protein [Nocardia carnea]
MADKDRAAFRSSHPTYIDENGEVMEIGVIGLGEMGSALASALLEAGHAVTVWNRSVAKAGPLVAAGAVLAASAEAVASAARLVVVNVQGGDTAVELLRSMGPELPGRAVVNLTDSTSEQVEAVARLASEHDAQYLHGQIMTIAPAIGASDTVIFYGGARPLFDRHEAVLRALGGRPTYISPDPTTPVLYGMAVHGTMWGLLNGYLHAAALLGQAGISLRRFVEDTEPSMTGMMSLFPMLADEIDRGDYATPFGALKHHLPSVGDLLDESRSRGIDTDLPEYTRRVVAEALAAGYGDDSYSRLVEHFNGACGVWPE